MITRRRLHLLTLVLTLVVAVPVAARQDSIAGDWELDVERSDGLLANSPAIPSRLTIEIQGDDVNLKRSFGDALRERTLEATYVADGQPHDVSMLGGTVPVRARWKKDKFSLSYTIARGGFESDVVETWSLSKNGELVIERASRIGDRPSVRKEFFRRVSAG
jgi:hypothetical protein